MLSIRRNNMTLSNAEQTQYDNHGSTSEYVHRLTISPLDSIWIAELEDAIQKRVVGYIDNHNTGVRRLDIILLPGEYLMITRKQGRDVINHTSRRIFKINNRSVEEASIYPRDTSFRKLDLTENYCNDINLRFLMCIIGEENLVHYQPWHRPMGFVVTDTVGNNTFRSSICYRIDGESVKLVKPTDWSDEWESDDNAVFAFIPFINVRSMAFVMRDTSKQLAWATELMKTLEKEGIRVNLEYRGDQKINDKLVPSMYQLHYPLPEQLFNVK